MNEKFAVSIAIRFPAELDGGGPNYMLGNIHGLMIGICQEDPMETEQCALRRSADNWWRMDVDTTPDRFMIFKKTIDTLYGDTCKIEYRIDGECV